MLASALWELNGENKMPLSRQSVEVWMSAGVAGLMLARAWLRAHRICPEPWLPEPGQHHAAVHCAVNPSWCDYLYSQPTPEA